MTFRIIVKKRIAILICILSILLAGFPGLAGSVADGNHPITLTITCDPDPKLEEGGTVPDLLFTIRNTGDSDYTLENATLSGGYEDRAKTLDEKITVLAGGTKEFHLTDVAVSDEQLDTDISYLLSWEEIEIKEDEESGGYLTVTHQREVSATINIPRFVLPELTVSASANVESVRAGETFTVQYTIKNDTKFDMSGLKLYDPEQSMQRIELPSTDLYAGEQRSVEITCTMGKKGMIFKPVVEYTVRQREMITQAKEPLKIESIIVNVTIEVQQYPVSAEGVSFAITVKNAGNRTVTDIRLYDEINTLIGEAFDLAPEQSKVLEFKVPSAISSDFIRKVRFHVRAVDCLGTTFTVTDPKQYEAIPYVGKDDVKLYLYVELQRAFYNEDGKLCGAIQFEIRNYSAVTLHNAVLYEEKLFKNITGYTELQNGETYYSAEYQLDGVKELVFRVSAFDPAENEYQTGDVTLDLTNLKALADQTTQTVYVYPNNPFFKNLIQKLEKPVRIAAIIALSVVAACLITCIALYISERRLRAKLPPAFEDDMEKAMQKTKRRLDNPLFKDAPTEQFGYTVPIKLRDYGELTEEEAEARRSQYAKKLRENLDRDAKTAEKPSRSTTPDPEDQPEAPQFAQTRIIPLSKVRHQEQVQMKEKEDSAEDRRAAQSEQKKSEKTEAVKPEEPLIARSVPDKPIKAAEPSISQTTVIAAVSKNTAAAAVPLETAPEIVPDEEPVETAPEAFTAEPVKEEPEIIPVEKPAETAPEAFTAEPVKEEPEVITAEEPVETAPVAFTAEPVKEEPEVAPDEEPAETAQETLAAEPVKEEPEVITVEESVETAQEALIPEPIEAEPAELPLKEEQIPESFEERTFYHLQLPSFLAQYRQARAEQQPAESTAASEPEGLSDAPTEDEAKAPARKLPIGPYCFDAMQRTTRRALEKQMPKRMNG